MGEWGAGCWDCSESDISACSWGLGVLWHRAELGLLTSPLKNPNLLLACSLPGEPGEYSSCASATPESASLSAFGGSCLPQG